MKKFLMSNRNSLSFCLAFLSGISALIYQIVWIRQFSLFFGVHVLSVSTVLAAFMAGLAIGNFLFGRWVDREIHPLILLIIIEAGIGLFALLFQPGLNVTMGIYQKLIKYFGDFSDKLPLLKFGLSFLLLLIPTTLMGGVVPVISKYMVNNLIWIGNRISRIYSWNNLGAVTGCILAGFFLIPLVGTRLTIVFASFTNFFNVLMAGMLFFSLHSYTMKNKGEKQGESKHNKLPVKYPRYIIKIILWVFAIEGFTTLGYEVLWNRILIEYVFEKNTYYYTTVILSFIAGLSLGSYLIRNRVDKISNQVRFLGILEIVIGVSALGLFILFVTLAPSIIAKKEAWNSWPEMAFRQYSLVFLILIIPASFMGITFPVVSKIYNDHLDNVGKRIGFIGFLDTAGSIFGSFITGFVLIRWTGIYYAFLIVVFLNLLPGLLLAVYSEKTDKIQIGVPVTAVIAFFLIVLFLFPRDKYFNFRSQNYPGEKIIGYYEGPVASVSVNRIPSGHLALIVNGAKTAYSNTGDIRVHTLLAYLPYIFANNPSKALVIGYGMGVTVNCLSKIPGSHVDVAEISREVMEASSVYFTFLNDHSEKADNVNLVIDDGRSYLFRSEGDYNIITTNAVHPRLSPNLYTLEFYQLCADKMRHDGIICQWLPTNWMTKSEFESLVKAFTEIFHEYGLWYVSRSHLLILGSREPFIYDFMNLSAKITDPSIMQQLIECEIYNPAQVASLLLATDNELINLYDKSIPDRDNYPVIEYSKEINLGPDQEVLKQIIDLSFVPGDKWKFSGGQRYGELVNHYHAENITSLKRFLEDYKGL